MQSKSDLLLFPSYHIAEVVSVQEEHHTISVKFVGGDQIYNDVLMVRDPGVFSLPVIGDICLVIRNRRNKYVCIGVLPAYYKSSQLDPQKGYRFQEGERGIQTPSGQKLLFDTKGNIILTTQLAQGLEILKEEGETSLGNATVKIEGTGVQKNSGFVKRNSFLAKALAVIFTNTGLDASTVPLTASKALVEDSTIITDPNLLNKKVYEDKKGTYVLEEDAEFNKTDVKTVPTNSDTGLPLRSRTKYYTEDGLTYLEVLVDTLGNTKIDIPITAIDGGANIQGLLSPLILDFLNITLGSSNTQSVSIEGTTITIGDQAATLVLGGASTSTTLKNDVLITGNLVVSGSITGGNLSTIGGVTLDAGLVGGFPPHAP